MIKTLSRMGWCHDNIHIGDNLNDVINRLKKAWADKELVIVENRHGRLVYIIGIESKTDKFREEIFVTVEDDRVPDSIIGDLEDLIDYLLNQRIVRVGFGEIDDIEKISEIRRE